MLFSSSKCPLPALVMWCRTLHHSLSAGLDPVRIFKQQAKSGPRALRDVAGDVAGKLSAGESLEDAFAEHQNRFPPLFLELVAVGEQTGRLEDAFRELERYYDQTLTIQRNFRSQMMYPAIQFILAVLIISGLIFILGMLAGSGKAITTDPTGLGFTGSRGALMFLVIMFGIVGGLLFAMKLTANNVRWRARLEGMMMPIPGWGPALLALALQRFCVALRMCIEAGLRAEKTIHYCFRATSNSAFSSREEKALAVVKQRRTLTEALEESGAPFPDEFRESVMVGEETGNLSEVMERLSERYAEEAQRRLKTAAQTTSYLIYGLVALFIILAIFRIASLYLGMLGAAAG
jgi:type II secretory pathway component PulF